MCRLTNTELRDDPDDDDDDFEHVEAPSSNGVVDSVSDAASSLSSSVSSAVSSVGSALSGSSDDGNSASASATEHKSRSATPAPQHKGSAFDLDTQRHGGPQAAGAGRIGPSYSGTTNHTAGPSAASLLALTHSGESDHLGRNAAAGSRPSGKSEAAQAAHRESVEKTRAGEHAVVRCDSICGRPDGGRATRAAFRADERAKNVHRHSICFPFACRPGISGSV